jgi:hypothetical protein
LFNPAVHPGSAPPVPVTRAPSQSPRANDFQADSPGGLAASKPIPREPPRQVGRFLVPARLGAATSSRRISSSMSRARLTWRTSVWHFGAGLGVD